MVMIKCLNLEKKKEKNKRLKEALERVELVHQAVIVDLSCVVEVSSLCF